MRFRVASTVFAAGFALAAAPLAGQTPTAADLARALQTRYATVRDFTATFTQSLQGGVLRTVTTTERGEVKVKKPGRMWWTYTSPQKKEFVADGARIYYYNVADRSGTESAMPAGENLSTAILFLAGRGDLVRDFTASMPVAQPIGEWHLRLAPTRRQDDFVTLTLIVDAASMALRGLITVDHQKGVSTIRFSNLRENIGLKDTDFVFKFPRGAHVVSAGRVP